MKFNTFEGVCYDPDLSLVVNLFTIHMESEDEAAVCAGLSYLKETVIKYDKVFKPHGFVCDAGNTLRLGLTWEFPGTPQVTDDFHFKQNAIQMLSSVIGTANDQIRFLKFMVSLFEASNPVIYEKVKAQFSKWIRTKPERQAKLEPYVAWWHSRRAYWSTAFKNPHVEKHSLAETANGMAARRGISSKYMSIERCIQWELLLYVRHSNRINELKSGGFVPSGTTRVNLKDKEMNDMFERVKNYSYSPADASAFLDKLMKSLRLPVVDEDVVSVNDFVDVNLEAVSSCPSRENDFRYREKGRKVQEKKDSARKPGRPKGSRKKRVSLAAAVESSDDEAAPPPAKKKSCSVMPKNWGAMEKKVEECKANYTGVDSVVDAQGVILFTITNPKETEDARRVKRVRIDPNLSLTLCSCEQFSKFQKSKKPKSAGITMNCKHIVFIMGKIGVANKDPLLAKHELSEEDLRTLDDLYFKWVVEQTESGQLQQHPVPSQQQQHMSSSNPVTDTTSGSGKGLSEILYFPSETSALSKLRKMNSLPRWSACIYVRGNKRGPGHQCTSVKDENNQHHYITVGTVCLKVDFEHVHFVKNDLPYCLQSVTKYFCLNMNCLKNPRSTITKNSNFSLPQLSSIDTANLSEDDRRKVERCFSNSD